MSVTAFSQRHFILEVYKQYIWSESVYVCICLAVADYAFQDFLEVVQWYSDSETQTT